MTTDHASKIWGFSSGITGSLAGQQMATRIRRQMPSMTVPQTGGTLVRPYVARSWPLPSDRWGVAYPAGLLMVVGEVGVYGSGTINDQMENYWVQTIQAGAQMIFPVPQILPSGYTRSTLGPAYGFSSSIYPGPPWVRIDGNGIPNSFGWTPRLGAWGDQFETGMFINGGATFANNYAFRTDSFGTPITSDVGYRKCQLVFHVSVYHTPAAMNTLNGGSLSYTISHNADGSIGSSTGDLDTIDFSGSVSYSQINANTTYAGGTYTALQSNPIDIGALAATLGKPCDFKIRATACSLQFFDGVSTIQADVGITVQASLRCDIPFQVNIPGADNLVAPGGWVP